MNGPGDLILPHGGYRKLRSFAVARVFSGVRRHSPLGEGSAEGACNGWPPRGEAEKAGLGRPVGQVGVLRCP
jgi:hypothetical protein